MWVPDRELLAERAKGLLKRARTRCAVCQKEEIEVLHLPHIDFERKRRHHRHAAPKLFEQLEVFGRLKKAFGFGIETLSRRVSE